MKNHILTVLLLLVTMVWGYTFAVVQTAAKEYGVASFLTLRFAIGSVCLLLIGWKRVNLKALMVGAGIGLSLAIGYFCQTLGLRYTSSTSSGLITSLLVIAAPLFNRMLFGVRTRALLWIAVVLTMVGMILLTRSGQPIETAPTNITTGMTAQNSAMVGDMLTLAGAIAFGLHIVLLDRYSRHYDTLVLTIGQTAMSVALFAAAWPLTDSFVWPSYNVWMALLLTGIVATAIGFYVQTLAQRHLPAARIVVIVSMEAVFAMFFGYVRAGDRLTILQLFGAVLMLVAVALAEIVPTVFPKKGGASLPEVELEANDCQNDSRTVS